MDNMERFVKFNNDFETTKAQLHPRIVSLMNNPHHVKISNITEAPGKSEIFKLFDNMLVLSCKDSELFFAKFWEAMNFKGNQSLDRLTEEIEDWVQLLSEYLNLMEAMLMQMQVLSKTRIQILLRDDRDRIIATCPQLERGFICDLLKSDSEAPPSIWQQWAEMFFKVLCDAKVTLPAVVGDDQRPPTFVVAWKRAGVHLADVHIEPSSNMKLIRLLADHCRNNPVQIGRKMAKVNT